MKVTIEVTPPSRLGLIGLYILKVNGVAVGAHRDSIVVTNQKVAVINTLELLKIEVEEKEQVL